MSNTLPWILVADQDTACIAKIRETFEPRGCRVSSVHDSPKLLASLDGRLPDLLILNTRLRGRCGLEIYKEILNQGVKVPTVFVAQSPSVAKAILAFKLGALDFVEKPLSSPALEAAAGRTVTARCNSTDSDAKSGPADAPGENQHRGRLLGNSTGIQKIRDLIETIATTDASVLILGENGTGKELVAREIHQRSRRHNYAFLPLNLSAIPRSLIESTLFGHEKGAFTGADRTSRGYCEEADNGTLFLDEIGELSLDLQPKLLRFLQEQTIQRVGSSQTHHVDVRILAATNRDMGQLVREGKVREDLYYRLNIVPVSIPPLRDRQGDVSLLAELFREKACKRHLKHVTAFTPAALDVMSEYTWPGNVRQLENLVERLVILCSGDEIGVGDLPQELLHGETSSNPAETTEHMNSVNGNGRKLRPIRQMEQDAIVAALADSGGHVATAARSLGLGQATLYRKMKRYGISRH